MEPQFKTSFIPKQALRSQEAPHSVAPRRRSMPMSLATAGAFLILLIALGASASLYAYKQHLVSSINEARQNVEAQRKAFEPALIKEYTRTANRIESAKDILERHNATTFVFALLEQTTLRRVQYQTMTFNYNQASQDVTLNVVGVAKDFRVLALQSDVYGSNQFFHNPAISDLEVQDDGTVKFKLAARLDPRIVSYRLGFEQGAYETPTSDTSAVPEPSSGAGL